MNETNQLKDEVMKNEVRIEEIKERMDNISTEIVELREEISELESDRDDIEIDPDTVEDQYIDMLNSEGPVTVCGMEFDPARILQELDPTAYNCGLGDYVSGLDVEETEEYKELTEQIDNLEDKITDLESEQEELEEELSVLLEEEDEEDEE